MRDRMERLVLLPFAVGCMSESSVGVASPPAPARRSRAPIPRSPPIRNGDTEQEESDDETSSEDGRKSPTGSVNLPKPNISAGIHRMFKGFKSFSHLFVYKEDMGEEEMEIEIGLPTDVKHVTHIGWDGCGANFGHPTKGSRWDNLFIDPNLISNRDIFQPLASPSPTASRLEQLEGRPDSRDEPQAANPESHTEPVPVKG